VSAALTHHERITNASRTACSGFMVKMPSIPCCSCIKCY